MRLSKLAALTRDAKPVATKYLPKSWQERYGDITGWLKKHKVSPGHLIFGPGLNAFFGGVELAEGKSLSSVLAENAGWIGTDRAVVRLFNKAPNFKGKPVVSGIARFIIPMFGSSMAGDFVEKHLPIGRFAKPKVTETDIPLVKTGSQLVNTAAAIISSKYHTAS